MNKQDFDNMKLLIEAADSVLLTTHERTDGDDLGSVLAIAHHIQNQGKKTTIAIKGGVPEQLKYMPGSEKVLEEVPDQDYDLVIISGCSRIERTGNEIFSALELPIINIDHHPDNTNYGSLNVVDPAKSSVAELVYDCFMSYNWAITPQIATCLLTGVFTDTGSFMHSNTSAATLEAAAALMQKGARTSTVAKNTYNGKNIQALKTWGKALENAVYDDKQKIIVSIITEDELKELGHPPLEYFEGLVETLNKVPDAKFALFLKQDGDTIKGSLRSDPHKGIDVKKIAQQFGGGGHVWASGFSVIGKLERSTDSGWRIIH